MHDSCFSYLIFYQFCQNIISSLIDGCSRAQLQAHLSAYLPSEEEETAKCVAIVDAGARDGVSGELALSVDGMPLETSLEILRKLKTLKLNWINRV